MATALPSFVTCDVCFEIFKEPKSLACRHTFCSTCVDKIKRGNQVECPMCKRKSELKDIEPDFKISQLVEAYNAEEKVKKENDQNNREKVAFGGTIKCCEVCSSPEEHPIMCKCKQCNKLMCKECKVSHDENTLYRNHSVMPIVSLAAEAKTGLLKLTAQIKEKAAMYGKNRELLTKCLEDCNTTELDASQLIEKKAASLINAIKEHHDELQRKVHEQHETRRNTCKKILTKTDYGLLDIQGKLHVISDLVDKSDDVTLADIGEDVVNTMYEELACCVEIPPEITENFKMEVIDGEAFDESKSTKLSMSPWLVGNSTTENKDTPSIKDYSIIGKYDFKLEKVVAVPENHVIASMILTKSEVYCISSKHIYVYNKQLELKKSIALELVTDAKAVALIKPDYLLTACCDTGLHLHNREGTHLQRISLGHFITVFVLNHKIHAFDQIKAELITFEQVKDTMEKVETIKYSDVVTSSTDTKLVPLPNNKLCISRYSSSFCCIYQCDFTGKLLNTFGSYEQLSTESAKQGNSGKLFYPHVCCADNKGNVIIADEYNDRLQLCTTSGEWSVILLRGEQNLA